MPGIGFILMYFFLVTVSQAELGEPYTDAFDGGFTDASTYWNEDLFDLRNSGVQGRVITNDQECSCTYDYSNGFVKARLGHKLLEKGDSIMRGETVSFECRYVNTVLMWENGLRFYGRANMTCNTCEKWQKKHLPACRSAQQVDVVLSLEDDLPVLPGGTVILQTGQSCRFSCNNIWRQPEWRYGRRKGISVKKVEHREERETIFVSYLEITDAEDKHSGMYECFSRTPTGHQTLSTVMHIKVVGNSDNDGTTSFTSLETGVSLTESTTSTSREIPDDENIRECSCKYDPGNRSVIAFLGNKRLHKEDTIRRGDTVSFHCGKRKILSWMNGLRYQGKAHMTCSKCEVWTDTELPTCHILSYTGHGALISEEELSFLPGGILQMREGESRNITCASIKGQTHWVFETKDNVLERKGSTRSYLEIKNVKYDNKGEYKCVTSEGVAAVLNLEVESKSIDSTVRNCSDIFFTKKNGLRRILYAGDSVGHIARFWCPPSTKLIGSSHSTCLENGTWSNPAPVCIDSTALTCSQIPSPPGLIVEYSGFSVGSIAQFKCFPSTRKLIGSTDSTCLEDGTWNNPTPICDDPKCSIQDLISSFPFDVTLDTPNVIDEFSPGSEVQLKCKGESLMEGDSTARCGGFGRWQVDNLRCVPGCRLDVNPSSKLLVQPWKSSYRIGEFVSLSCPPSYKLSNDVERLMCMFDKWSSPLPECVPETN